MKTILLYGTGEVAKRNYLLKLKQNFKGEVQTLDLKNTDLGELKEVLISPSLFDSGPRLVVGENISESLELDDLRGDEYLNLVLVASSLKATSPLLKSAQKLKTQIIEFAPEKELNAFPFVDAFLEGDKRALVELEKLLNEFGGIYCLSMIFYGLRRNLLPLPTSGFMKTKVQKQKAKFSKEDFKKIYRQSLETEYRIKSGVINEELGLGFLVEGSL